MVCFFIVFRAGNAAYTLSGATRAQGSMPERVAAWSAGEMSRKRNRTGSVADTKGFMVFLLEEYSGFQQERKEKKQTENMSMLHAHLHGPGSEVDVQQPCRI
jgi:hypothetical protein